MVRADAAVLPFRDSSLQAAMCTRTGGDVTRAAIQRNAAVPEHAGVAIETETGSRDSIGSCAAVD